MPPTDVFAGVAHSYLRAGWRGVLWLRPGTKWPPPSGYTGHNGDWPSPADVQTWCEQHPDANIALRLDEAVLGIDVDAYGDKTGGKTLTQLEEELGPLPPTVVSSSRTDGISGIRLYRIPPAPAWPNQAGDGIELIHYGHRYVVCWPSRHPEGGTYRWVDQRTGEILTHPPDQNQLPDLPQPWLNYLQSRAGTVADKTDVDNNQVTDWLQQLRPGEPCDKVHNAHLEAAQRLLGGDSARHDVMVTGTAQLIGLGSWGHAGTADALTDLRTTFLEVSTRPGEGQRTTDQAIAEWRRAITGAIAMHHEERPAPAQTCGCPLPSFDPNIEEAFWTARPHLETIRQFARARRTSPWAVLGVALTRIVTACPPSYVLPAIIGGRASTNLFTGIVAKSGGGKGAAEAAAADVINLPEDIHTVGVGSGEGIAHQYVRYVPPNKKTNEPGGIEQHNDRVLFTASEVDTLANLHSRQGSTLLAELRKLYMGEELSFAYVDPTKRLKVSKHTYRAGLIVGIQPARAGTLLDDADGGTPQRFVWLPGTDPNMPDHPPEQPDPINWAMPVPAMVGPDQVVIQVCDTARNTIDREHVKRNRGDGDALDGHALLTRLKWSAAFSLLDGRLNVTDDDWDLSGTLMDLSDHTRQQIVTELADKKRAANVARGIEYAERELTKEESMAEAATKRVARHILNKLSDGQPQTRKPLRNTLASRDRGYFDAALDRLHEAGQIVIEKDGRTTTISLAGRAA